MPADRLYCVRRTFGDHSGMLSDQNDHPGRVHLAASTFPHGKSSVLGGSQQNRHFWAKTNGFAKYRRSGKEFSIKSPHICYRPRECPCRGVRALDGRSGLITSRNDPQRSPGRNTGGLRALALFLRALDLIDFFEFSIFENIFRFFMFFLENRFLFDKIFFDKKYISQKIYFFL